MSGNRMAEFVRTGSSRGKLIDVDGAKEHWLPDEKGPFMCPYLSECRKKKIVKWLCKRPFNILTLSSSGKEQTDLELQKDTYNS